MATLREYMVRVAVNMANDSRYGYNNFYGPGSDNTPYNVFGQGKYPYDGDCGAFCSYCLNQALAQIGINSKEYYEPIGNYQIANEAYLLKYCNKYTYGAVSLEAGDILVSSGHTELYIGGGQNVGAHGNSAADGPTNGGVTNIYTMKTGDQGNEVSIGSSTGSAWYAVYRLKKEYGNRQVSGKTLNGINTPALKTFKPRTSATSPTNVVNNPCYNTSGGGGYNTCATAASLGANWVVSGANVLCNCVGYAQGRALEIYMQLDPSCKPGSTGKHPWMYCNGGPESWLNQAKSSGLKTGNVPKEGAVIVWSGHVGVVETVHKSGNNIDYITVSESGWPDGYGGQIVAYNQHYPDGTWTSCNGYSFLGFIYQPIEGYAGEGSGIDYGTTQTRNDIVTRTLTRKEVDELIKRYHGYDAEFEYKEVTTNRTLEGIQSSNTDLSRVRGPQLLSFPSLVEAPFCILKVGDYSFGTYMKAGDIEKIKYVKYPNFITSMRVDKVNGTVNQYVIVLTYQIEAGNDPNMVDKILSKVGYGTVYISYGDWACPNFIYKEEEAIITNVKSKVDFSSSRITYTISCTSNSIALAGSTFNFAARNAKPSDIIFEMLYNNQYGLLDLFPGMKNSTLVRSKGLIASNDQVVHITSKEAIDPLTYINYLVSCMSANTNDANSVLKDSTYYLTLNDDTRGELGGPYFKITEIKANDKSIPSSDTYVVDVGFPSDNLVTNFTVNDDNSWALLYNYSSSIDKQVYTYSLDDSGNIVTRYSPNITTSSKSFITTEAQKTWWTNMTRFPITAELTIKGLVRPSMLMTYVRINSFFYGQKHISSGLYVITKQVDTIDGTGYRTVLTLTRIGGADDYITSITKKVTTKSPIIKLVAGDGLTKKFNELFASMSKDGGGSEIHISSNNVVHGGGSLGSYENFESTGKVLHGGGHYTR